MTRLFAVLEGAAVLVLASLLLGLVAVALVADDRDPATLDAAARVRAAILGDTHE